MCLPAWGKNADESDFLKVQKPGHDGQKTSKKSVKNFSPVVTFSRSFYEMVKVFFTFLRWHLLGSSVLYPSENIFATVQNCLVFSIFWPSGASKKTDFDSYSKIVRLRLWQWFRRPLFLKADVGHNDVYFLRPMKVIESRKTLTKLSELSLDHLYSCFLYMRLLRVKGDGTGSGEGDINPRTADWFFFTRTAEGCKVAAPSPL